MTWTSFSCGTSGPLHVLHATHAICHALLCILGNGLGYSVQSFWQMPGICCTQSPSYNVLPRDGWQYFWYFCLVYSTRGRMTSTPCWWKCWGLRASPKWSPCRLTIAWVMPCSYSQQKCAWKYFSDCTKVFFLLWTSASCSQGWMFFHVGSLFDAEQLVSLHHHLVHVKGAIVLIKSGFLLCFGNSIVAPPHSMMTFVNLCHLGHHPKTSPSKSARGPHLLTELFEGRLDLYLLCVWAGEAIRSHWLLVWVGSTCPWLTAWVWLLDALVSFVFTYAPGRVSVIVSGAPRGLYGHPIVRVSSTLGWPRKRSISSGSVWSELWLVPGWAPLSSSGWIVEKIHSQLASASMVLAWVLLPPWSSSVLLGKWFHFLCLGLMVSLKIRNLMEVLVAGMSDIGRTGGGRVLAQCAWLLVHAGPRGPLNPGVMLSAGASTLGCMTVASASLTEHMGPMLELAATERNQGRSLTKLA